MKSSKFTSTPLFPRQALVALLLPDAAPLLGMFCFGNLMRESGVVERLSDTVACLTIYRPDAQDEVLDELIYHRETGLVSDTRFRCFQACTDENAPENVRTYTYKRFVVLP